TGVQTCALPIYRIGAVGDRHAHLLAASARHDHLPFEGNIVLCVCGSTEKVAGGDKDGLEDRLLDVALEFHGFVFWLCLRCLTMQNCRDTSRCHSPHEQVAPPIEQVADEQELRSDQKAESSGICTSTRVPCGRSV